METSVPYHTGFLLGCDVDVRTMTPGSCKGQKLLSPTPGQEAILKPQFSYIETLRDVCDVLNIPPEYALKVKAGIVKNEVVEICLKDLGSKNVFSVVFRTCFRKQETSLPHDSAPQSSVAAQELDKAGEMEKTTEMLTAGAAPCPESCHSGEKKDQHPTHWVKAVEIGDELVVVMKILSKDTEELDELRKKIDKYLEASCGTLDDKKLKALRKKAAKIDKKLSKKHYRELLTLNIHYGYFHELSKYPANMTGMVDTLEAFIDQWKEMGTASSSFEPKSCVMMCKEGEPLKIEPESQRVVAQPEEAPGEVGKKDEELYSLDKLDSLSPQNFYILRVTLRSFHEDTQQKGEDHAGSHAPDVYTDESYKMFETSCKFLEQCIDAKKLFQNFVLSKRSLLEDRTEDEDANAVSKEISLIYANFYQTVESLDFVHHSRADTLKRMLAPNPMVIAKQFIQKVTSKLPPGCDLDLLMIGKTGHGKSATGNSILGLVGQDAFRSAFSSQSVTEDSEVKYSEIDGRVLKVVDTPGVCDTQFSSKEEFLKHAVQDMTSAIVSCPKGFDALLIVISCKARITMEERGAIDLLKSVLGEDIIKSHCILVFTHGDQFEEGNFMHWCEKQSGFLKTLYEECKYRCVLFNNRATRPEEKKEQLIQLVAKVDKLKEKYPRYTNEIFDLACEEREKIIAEENKHKLSEKMMKDLQLLIRYLRDPEQALKKDKLKERLDSIKDEMAKNNVEDRALRDLISFIETHDNHSTPESQGEKAQNCLDTNMKESKEVDMRVAEKVEEKVKESSGGCFPGSSTIKVPGGKKITLDKLQVGDKVLVRDNTGALVFDTVYMFGHQDFDTSIEYRILRTALCDVFVSQDHLVYCMKDGKEQCIAAEKICVGDNILVATPHGLKAQPVVNITCQRKRGLFAPFTLTGTIVIDDALMSCYVDVLPAATAHRLLWPLRQLYQVSPRTLAFVNGSTSEHPVPRWVNTALKYI